MKKGKLCLGLFSTGIVLTCTLLSLTNVAIDNEMLINDVLGLTGTKINKSARSSYADEDGNLTDEGYSRMIKDSYDFCIQEEEEGAVLLKNNGALPLKEEERNVTLFGRNSAHLCLRSGAGGAAPNQNLVVHLDDAFKQKGFNLNQDVWNLYTSGSDPTVNDVKEEPVTIYTDSIKSTFSSYGDVAIVTFTRVGTENSDPAPGILDITQNEYDLLKMIHDSGSFKKTIVLLNGAMPMGLSWADDPALGVDAILWFGVPGYYSLTGVVNLLTGEKNPSGHTPDTFAAYSTNSAAYQNFGNLPFANGSSTGLERVNGYVVYKEGIYVGYKYYETRYEDVIKGQGNASGNAGASNGAQTWNYADEVAYPYGYGLSYTTFDQKITNVTYDEEADTYTVDVEVKNTGSVDGKSVVEVFVQQPYTDYDKEHGIEKSAVALMGYNKVDVKAGETATTQVTFDRYFMTSYDENNLKQYILEGGDYYLALGNGAHEALNNILGKTVPDATLYDHLGEEYTPDEDAVYKLTIEEDFETFKTSHYNDTEVTNQFDDADVNYWANEDEKVTYLTRQDWQGTFPTTMETLTINDRMKQAMNMNTYTKPANAPSYAAGEGTLYSVPYKNEEGEEDVITFSDMAGLDYDDPKWDAFIKQMSLDDLAKSMSDNRGILGVDSIKKPSNSIAEGPEGLLATFQYGDKRSATGFATGPIYTASWDPAIQTKFGAQLGEEALFAGVACMNAPGANINRTPYGSRASEYMSEDGIMNYIVASNITKAAREKGLILNIKHCFLNNQETNRQGVATFANEQSIREIYLKPFEGALTKGESLGIMTSYNRIGLTYAATHEVLMKTVIRGEWGYEGQIIDDALQGSNTSTYSNGPSMVAAGTDIFCLDGNRGAQLISYVEENDDGNMVLLMQEANHHILYSLLQSWMGDAGSIDENASDALANPWWKQTIYAIDGVIIGLTVIALGLYIFFDFFYKGKKEPETGEGM